MFNWHYIHSVNSLLVDYLKVDLPTVDLPSVLLPSVIVLSVNFPSIDLPSVILPSVILPFFILQCVILPSVSIPSIYLPSRLCVLRPSARPRNVSLDIHQIIACQENKKEFLFRLSDNFLKFTQNLGQLLKIFIQKMQGLDCMKEHDS